MLAVVMSLVVLGVACVLVVRDSLTKEPDKPATAPPRRHRERLPKAAKAPRRARALVVLLGSVTGIGVLTGVVVGLVAAALVLAVRSSIGSGP